MQFSCFIEQIQYTLALDEESLIIENHNFIYSFEISLNLQIDWNVQDERLVGFTIKDIQVNGDSERMYELQKNLAGRVMFKGICKFFHFEKTVYENPNGITKVCKLKNINTNQVYACKCYKKCLRSKDNIFLEFQILKQLINSVPTIYEFYESENSIYMISEWCYKGLTFHLKEEQIRVIMKNLFLTLKQMQRSFIAHMQIFQEHIFYDDQYNIKLLGFSKALLTDVNQNMQLDMHNAGVMLEQFYEQQTNQFFELQFLIPDLIRSLNYDENLSFQQKIENVLSNTYFQTTITEGLVPNIQDLRPSFKGRKTI